MTNSKQTTQLDLADAKYLVSFISVTSAKTKGYAEAAVQMLDAVETQAGFIGSYSSRDETGVGITNSYWSSIESIKKWKDHAAHLTIQKKGREQWYQWYQIQICEILRSNNYSSFG